MSGKVRGKTNGKKITVLFAIILAAMLAVAGCKGKDNSMPAAGEDVAGEQAGESAGSQTGQTGWQETDTEETENGTEPEEEQEEWLTIERTGVDLNKETEDGAPLFVSSLYYPNVQIAGEPQISAKINEVFEAQKGKDESVSQEYQELAAEEYENRLALGDESFWGFALNRDYMVPFQGMKLLTIKEVLYSYMGGVHPNSEILAWNFDLSSGELVALEQLAKDPEEFRSFLEDQVNRYLEKQQMDDGTPLTEGFYPNYQDVMKEELKRPVWYVSEGSLWIIFNEYVLAPYAAGIVETEVPLADCQEYLTEEALEMFEPLPETGISE